MANPVLVAKRVIATVSGGSTTYADATAETGFALKPGNSVYIGLSQVVDTDTPRRFRVALNDTNAFPTPYEVGLGTDDDPVSDKVRKYPVVEWKPSFATSGTDIRYSATRLVWEGTVRNIPFQGAPARFAFGVGTGTNSPIELTGSPNTQYSVAVPPALVTFGEYAGEFLPWDHVTFRDRAYDTTLVNRTIQAGATYKLGDTLANDAQKADIVWVRQRLNYLLGQNKRTTDLYDSDDKFDSFETITDLTTFLKRANVGFAGIINAAVFTALQIPTDDDGNPVGPPSTKSLAAQAQPLRELTLKDQQG